MAANVRLRSVVLPPEHGAWGFLVEPILLGLLVAPSWAGVCVAVAVIGGFLTVQPSKIALIDRRRGKRYARTRAAERFGLAFGALALVGGAAAIALAGPHILIPLLIALPLAGLLLLSYARQQGRDLAPELAGGAALALAAPSIALAGDASLGVALALWVIQAARVVPTTLYVRARLRLEKGQPHAGDIALAAHAVGLAAVIVLAALGVAPWLAALALIVLLARAARGLSASRNRVRPQKIGFLEIGYGLLTVLLTALGYALGI